MELSECIENRRSIRRYLNKPVDREIIKALIKAASDAPSWKNSQVSRYYVVDRPETKEAFLPCLAEFNQKNVKDAPVIIVSTVVKNRSGFERDGSYTTHLKDGFQYFDNGLQVENLCLKAYDLGLGTLIMGIYDNEAIRTFFAIPDNEEVVAVIGVGYADIAPEQPMRKGIEEIVHFKE